MKKFLLSLAVLGVSGLNCVADSWELSTEIDSEAEYLLLSGNVACANSTNAAYLSAVSDKDQVTIEENKIVSEIPSNAGVFKFEPSGDGYVLRIENLEGELSGYYKTTAAKKMSLVSDAASATQASVSFQGNDAVIVFGSYGTLYYNSSSPRFLNYTSKQTAVQLYKKVSGDTPVVPDQPVAVKLSFPQDSYSVMLGDSFEAPELTASAEGLAISYESSKPEVAEVNALTGEVTILGIGSTVITATSEATEDYLAGEASYTLIVNDPDAIRDVLNTEVVKANSYTTPVIYVSPVTNVTYTVQAHNSNGYQLNAKDGVGIASTANPDKYVISRIIINPYSGMLANQAPNGVKVYAGNQAYSSAGDLALTGAEELIASPNGYDQIVLIPEDDYFYFNITPNGGVYVIESLEIEWRKAELTKEIASLSFPEAEYTVRLGQEFQAPELTTNSDASPVYSSSNEKVATVDPATGLVTPLALGETVITAESPETDNFFYSKAEYTLYVIDAEDPTFAINFKVNDNDSSSRLDADSFMAQVETGAEYIAEVKGVDNVYGGSDGLKLGSNNNAGSFTLMLADPVALDRINVTVSSMKTDDGSALSVNGGEPVAVTDHHQVITLPFNGEKVESLSFEAKLVHLKGIEFFAGEEVIILKDAGLAFPEAEYEVELGKEFTAPALSKLTDAEAVYTSSNEEVATVDEATGEVTLLATGTTVITATTEATEEYKAGMASYTLTIVEASTPVIPDDPDPNSDVVAIVFKSNDADGSNSLSYSSFMDEIEEGAEYVVNVSDIDKVYPGKQGLKLGSSKAGGTFKMTIGEEYSYNHPVKSISLTASTYNGKSSSIAINGISTLDVVGDDQVLNYSFNGDSVTEITIESGARLYLKKIEINYETSGEEPDPKKEFAWEVEYLDSFAENSDDIFFEVKLPEDLEDAEGLFSWTCDDEENVIVEGSGATAEVLIIECGTYDIHVSFAGNDLYEASETTLTVNVHPDMEAAIGISEGEKVTVTDGIFFIPSYDAAYDYHYLATEAAEETPVFNAPARVAAEYSLYNHEEGIELPGIAGKLSLVVAKNGVESPAHEFSYEVETGVSAIGEDEADAIRFTIDGQRATSANRGITITIKEGRVEKTIR